MKKSILNLLLIVIVVILSFSCDHKSAQENEGIKPEYVLVIHGGAGYIVKDQIPEEIEKMYVAKLTEVLEAGQKVLAGGGSSLDAVETVITIMEDSPLFNAGKGAVFTEAGENEMDASIMDGSNLKAGAVGGVKTIKNPVTAARKVMDSTKHVMLVGRGAEKFAKEQGLDIVDQEYFFVERRWKSLQRAKEREKEKKHGTVGAVAIDKYGNLAAATSTGGLTNKMTGRIGDSPIVGAGNYANNKTCAISGTGHGEYFMRLLAAYDVSALMEYKGWSLEKAADFVIHDKFKEMNGRGGVIGVDKDGNITMTFNTEGMFRGYIDSEGNLGVELYAEGNR